VKWPNGIIGHSRLLQQNRHETEMPRQSLHVCYRKRKTSVRSEYFALADIAPNFVQFQTTSANANHHPVMQFSAAATNAGTEAHDGVAVDAGKALSAADALAFGRAGNDLDLLVAGKVVHEAHPSG
jgi:hypothetical protein